MQSDHLHIFPSYYISAYFLICFPSLYDIHNNESSADCTPTSLAVSNLQVSDHLLVALRIPANKPTVEFKTYTSRQWSKFDMCHFEHDLAASELATTDSTDVDHLFLLYNSTMQYLISTRRQQPCAAACDHSHCGLMQNVYKPRETSAVLSLRTTTRKRSSATGYGGARWSSTTYYCGGSKSATGVAVYEKLVGMLENCGRRSLIYWSLRQLPLITFQPNSSQLYSRTRWTPFGQVW